MKKSERAEIVRTILDKTYPETPIPLNHKDIFTLLIAVLLSAQCTDERVNQVNTKLLKLATTPEKISKLSQEKIYKNTKILFEGEKQNHVDILFGLYKLFYGAFDKTIYVLDSNADKGMVFPNWLMTSVSTLGLGFQLLIIAVMLVLGLKAIILPFFAVYTLMIFVFIGIRRLFYQKEE